MVLSSASACSDDDSPKNESTAPAGRDDIGATALFVVPASLDELTEGRFFEPPFPSDLRKGPDGKVSFVGWPNPFKNVIIENYLQSVVGAFDGFSPAAPLYVRFSGPINPASLPKDPPAAMAR